MRSRNAPAGACATPFVWLLLLKNAYASSASPASSRNAGTWNVRGGSAAQRFDYLYSEEELREWVPPLRELSNEAEQAYAFFNNNNQTNGVAQAPAGALLLRKLLEEEKIPAA